MSQKRFNISIRPKKKHHNLPDHLLETFSCIISEPDHQEKTGKSIERQLVFLDREGQDLKSPVLEDLAFFYRPKNAVPEEHEIQSLIYTKLEEAFKLTSKDVEVEVTGT
jgi:hypothetical protein